MALRFHCEHCGKRLQANVARGDAVSCPFCRGQLTVPAHATEHVARTGSDSEHENTREDGLVVAAARVIPGWGTSVVLHLAILLVALMATWSSMHAEVPPEYNARMEQQKDRNVKNERAASRSTHKTEKEKKGPIDFTYKKSPEMANDYKSFNQKRNTLIGVVGLRGGDDIGGVSDFGRGRRGDSIFGDGEITGKGRSGDVVYIIDRSGSMTDSLWFIKAELRRSLRSLTPSQKFHVIFYSTGPARELSTGRLVAATEPHRQQAYSFIDEMIASGGTDPREAIKAAFRLKPDKIHLLSDGEFEKPKETIQLIDRLNARKKVTINTYSYLYESPDQTMQTIAARNKGTYRFVGEDVIRERMSR